MLKKISLLIAAGALAMSVVACGNQPQEPKKDAAAPESKPGEANLALPQKGQEATVELPADVKGKWKSIKVTVEDKKNKSAKEVTIAIGQTAQLPGTKLSLQAVEFVPAFVMQGLKITSASNDQQNPAAKVIITEDGKEVFKGWLFQKFPTTHAFSHPDYSVMLTGAEKS